MKNQEQKLSDRKKISVRILNIREMVGISETEFSKKLDHTGRWLNALKLRKSDVKASDIIRLKEVYKVNPDYILFGEEPMFLEKSNGRTI